MPAVTPLKAMLGSALVLMALAGCGYSEYERRVNETGLWFAYVDRLDRNLNPVWGNSAIKELRVPQQFVLIPAPEPVKGPDGKPMPAPVDPRQPDYVSLTLPQLLGAWQARLPVSVGGGNEIKGAYIYAMSNAGLQSTGDKSAGLFTQRLIDTLKGSLQKAPAPGDRETYPKTLGYRPQKMYEVTRFSPEQPIDGVPYTFEVYSHHAEALQVVILVVLPVGVDTQQRITERIAMMLETLDVNPGAAGAATGSATAPAGGASF